MNCSSAEGAANPTRYGANKAASNGSNSSARDSPYTSEGRANYATDICAASSTKPGPAQCATKRRITAICPADPIQFLKRQLTDVQYYGSHTDLPNLCRLISRCP